MVNHKLPFIACFITTALKKILGQVRKMLWADQASLAVAYWRWNFNSVALAAVLASLVLRPCPAFHCLQYIFRSHAGRAWEQGYCCTTISTISHVAGPKLEFSIQVQGYKILWMTENWNTEQHTQDKLYSTEYILNLKLVFHHSLEGFKTPVFVRKIEGFKHIREWSIPAAHS